MSILDQLLASLGGGGAPTNRLNIRDQNLMEAGYVLPNRLAQPQGAPQAGFSPSPAPQAAPQVDPSQTASTAGYSGGGGGGGFLSRLFGGGGGNPALNETVDWLQKQGYDPGTAHALAGNKAAMQKILLSQAGGNKPIEINGRLVDPQTFEVLADFSDKTPKQRHTVVIDGKLIDTDSNEVLGDYGEPDVQTRTMTPEEVKAAGLAPGVWQIDKDNKISKAGDAAPVAGAPFRFDATSVEGQALNGLMESGILSPTQAQELATSKTITNPADGSVIILTPRGIFSIPAEGGTPRLLSQPPAGQPPAASSANAPIATTSAGALGTPIQPAQAATNAPTGATETTPGIITITGPKPGGKKTESQERYTAISEILLNEVPTISANFKALSDPTGQLLSQIPGGLGNMWQSEEYQRAANSASTVISGVLYALSGASSNPGEVIAQIKNLTPAFGEKPGTIADKLQRFKTYVRAVASGSGDAKLKQMIDEAIAKMDAPDAGKARQLAPGVTIEEMP